MRARLLVCAFLLEALGWFAFALKNIYLPCAIWAVMFWLFGAIVLTVAFNTWEGRG